MVVEGDVWVGKFVIFEGLIYNLIMVNFIIYTFFKDQNVLYRWIPEN